MTHTKDVRINGHCRLSESYRLDDVSRLAPHPRQLQQQVHIAGHLAVETFYQQSRHYQVLGLGVGIAHAAHIFQHILGLGLGHRLGIGIATEEVGRHLIDTLVGTLGAEHHGHQQLEDTTKLEFGGDLWHLLAEMLQHLSVSLVALHPLTYFESFCTYSTGSPSSLRSTLAKSFASYFTGPRINSGIL